MSSTDENSKEMAVAILKQLQELEFGKSSKALEKEILKRFSLKSLPSTSSEKVLVLQETKKAEDDNDDDDSSTSSSSSSSSSDDDDDKKAVAAKKDWKTNKWREKWFIW